MIFPLNRRQSTSAFGDHRQIVNADEMILVVRDEGHAKMQSGCGNPSVRRCNRSPVTPSAVHRLSPTQRQGVRRVLDDVPFQTGFEMLPSSRSPARSDRASEQFRLCLKTDYQDITEKVRLVEFRFVGGFVEI